MVFLGPAPVSPHCPCTLWWLVLQIVSLEVEHAVAATDVWRPPCGLGLLLDPDQSRPYYIPTDVAAEMAKLPKSPVGAISDHMGARERAVDLEIRLDAMQNWFRHGFVLSAFRWG